MTKRYEGKLIRFDPEKGFGFVELAGFEDDIFVHKSQIPRESSLANGQVIEFSIAYREKDKKPQAREIKVLFSPVQLFTPDHERPNPYSFVPVCVDQPAPLFRFPGHDGTDDGACHSGELCITLKALTPLLVGQRQHQREFEEGHPLRHSKEGEKRALLEPWRLDDEQRRVAIPGSSIKGMLRHHLAALLNAPMERVAEQEYTYRPNLDHPKTGKPVCEFREAVVQTAPDNQFQGMQVIMLGKGRKAIFVQSEALALIEADCSGRVPKGAKFDGIEFHSTMSKRRLIAKENTAKPWTASENYKIVKYSGGLAGVVDANDQSPISERHDRSKRQDSQSGPSIKLYTHVLIPEAELVRGTLLEVPSEVVARYFQTLKSLANTQVGHSSSRNPNLQSKEDVSAVSNSFEKARAGDCIAPGKMIYLESSLDGTVQSIGHSFRYRWLYKDSTTMLNVGTDRQELRPQCAVNKAEKRWARRLAEGKETPFEDVEERLTAEQLDGGLTASRAMFGYVAEEGIFGSEFKGFASRLAGRVSANHAVEVIEQDGAGYEKRFLKGGGIVPFRPMGSPKSSAVEFYVKQRKEDLEKGRLTTYGDFLSEADSELAGRKFYRHQSRAADDPSAYEASSEAARRSHLAPLARFVSSPGTQFRFTLRFRALSDEELGALLFILAIDRASEFGRIEELFSDAPPEGDPGFALKLGYGRPLGLGSVTASIDKVITISANTAGPEADLALDSVLEQDHATIMARAAVTITEQANVMQWVNERIKCFLAHGEELAPNIRECLQVWRYSGTVAADYPTFDGEIHKFHTECRKHHSRSRRNIKAGGDPSPLLDRVVPDAESDGGI